MNYVCALIMGYSDGVPDESGENNMIMLGTGFEQYENESIIPTENCSYVTTFAHKTNDIDASLREIRETWLEWTQKDINLEVITTDSRLITRDQKKSFKELENGEWSYRLPVVVYCRGNNTALEEAKAFIIECSVKKRWKFWQ